MKQYFYSVYSAKLGIGIASQGSFSTEKLDFNAITDLRKAAADSINNDLQKMGSNLRTETKDMVVLTIIEIQ